LRPSAGGSGATIRSLTLTGLDPATADLRLSSPALRAFLAQQETLARPSSASLRACGCGPAVMALSTAIRPREARSETAVKEITMAQIGAFTRSDDGTFNGTIRTLTLNIRARFVPAEASQNDKAPDLRVLSGSIEIGAAWKRTSKEGTVYHSVKLDDPSFPAPIFANLVEVETGYALVWSR
jgi:uncharacterized protein (DUF736 family)